MRYFVAHIHPKLGRLALLRSDYLQVRRLYKKNTEYE